MRRPLVSTFAACLAAAAASGLPPVPEQEPDSFSGPSAPPQALGTLDAGGLSVAGALDPTSPDGLAPGDDDGFSFSPAADGDFQATLSSAPGDFFVLALAREDEAGLVALAATSGPSPLVLAVPGLTAGATYRVGVAALGDGTPAAYQLDLAAVAEALPPWTGETCAGFTPEAEPDDTAVDAFPLGDFVRVLCASGSFDTIVPGGGGDVDTFRFRNVLPVPVRLAVTADPGQVTVEFQKVAFVGVGTVVSVTFSEAVALVLPALAPGQVYLVRLEGKQGTVPLNYSFHLEPSAPPGPAVLGAPVERAVLRMGEDPAEHSFTLRAGFPPGDFAAPTGSAVSCRVRGLADDALDDPIEVDRRGRYVYRGGKRAGLRSLVLDPSLGRLTLRGKGADLAGEVDPADPAVSFEVRIGDLIVSGTADGRFPQGNLALLKVLP